MMRGLAMVVALAAAPTPRAACQELKVDVPIKELEERSRRDSLDPVAYYNLALGYWSEEKWDSVGPALDRAIAIDPRFAAAHLALAYLPKASLKGWKRDVLQFLGRRIVRYTAPDSVVQEADRRYRGAFMIDLLVDIRIAVATERRGGQVDRFDRALFAYNDGKWDEAYRRFGEMVADSSDYRDWKAGLYDFILWYHALAATRLNQHDDAIRSLEWLLARSTKREASDTMYRWALRTNEYRYALAYAKQRAGDANGAIPLYREVIGNDAGLYMAHVRLAEVFEGARMWDAAVEARRHAVNANPDDPSLLTDLGLTLAKAGRREDAEEALRQAMEANPRDSRVPYYLGVLQQQIGKRDEARASLTRFLSLAPSRYERQIQDAKTRLAGLQ